MESWLTTIICSGMAPWGDFLFNLLHASLVGPLKMVAFFIQWHFQKIVRECAAKKEANLLVKDEN